MILLLGLLQPSLVLAEDATGEEETVDEEVVAEETDEVANLDDMAEENDEDTDGAVKEDETDVDTESQENGMDSEKTATSELTAEEEEVEENQSKLPDEEDASTTITEKKPEENVETEASEGEVKENIESEETVNEEVESPVPEITAEEIDDIGDLVTNAYLDGNVVSANNSTTNLVLDVVEESMLHLINVYDIVDPYRYENGLAGYLRDDNVNLVDLEPGVNSLSFSTNYCPSFADATDCVYHNFDLPDGVYRLSPRILYQDSFLGNLNVQPYIVKSTPAEITFDPIDSSFKGTTITGKVEDDFIDWANSLINFDFNDYISATYSIKNNSEIKIRAGNVTIESNGTFTIPVSDLASEDYTIDVTVEDVAGNTVTSSLPFTLGEEEVNFSFELTEDSTSEWELAREGIEFRVWGPSNQEATLSIGDKTIEFEVNYHYEGVIVTDLSPGTHDVEVRIGGTTKTQQLEVVSDEEFYEDDSDSNPRLDAFEYVLTKSEAKAIGSIEVAGDDFLENTSIDVLVNGDRVETLAYDFGTIFTDVEVSGLPVGEHTIEFVQPTRRATHTLFIVADEHGELAPAGTYEGTTVQYMGGSEHLNDPFELPITFEVDENGVIKNLEVEYWWVCVRADGQSGFTTAMNMPDTQITVNQPFQIDWEETSLPYSFVGMIYEDGTASGTFYAYSPSCGTSAATWNLESDTPPVTQPDEFEVELEPDTTEETEGPLAISVTTTSDPEIVDLKWLEGDRTEADFANAGHEIDLTSKAFTVDENGTYTVYARNAEDVIALTSITINYIVDPVDPGDPLPSELEIDFNETVEVAPAQLITIRNTSISLQLPEDLPEGTTLTIQDVSNEDAVGDVIHVDLNLPDGKEDFEGSYLLTLGVDESYVDKEIAIFYYNDESDTWENKGGTVDRDARTITISVSHFSMYAVFALEDEDEPGNGTDPGDRTDPSDGTDSGDGSDPGDGTDPGDGSDPGDNTDPGDTADPGDDTSSGDDTDPGDDTNPGDSTDRDDDTNSSDDTESGDDTDSAANDDTDNRTAEGDNVLPKTSTDLFNLLAIGSTMLLFGIVIFLVSRRRKPN